MEGFNFDEIQKQLAEAIKLEKNENDLSVKMVIIADGDIQENQMVGQMLEGEEQMKAQFGQFLQKDGPLDCDVDINMDEKYVLLTMRNKEDFEKVHELLHEMFFGDFFKKMMEAMMGAFGDMMGGPPDEEE